MTSVALLKLQAEYAWANLLEAIEGVTQSQAWAVLPRAGSDYLHTNASIQGMVLHMACCKFMYGSVAFRNTEIRWRDCAERLDAFEPDWAAAQDFLKEAHAYWVDSWAGLTDEGLEREVSHFRGTLWPTWRIIQTVTHHDGWHGGQIAVLRYAVGESDTAPSSEADDLRNCCQDLPTW